MSLIPGYPEGSDITIMNTIYLKPRKDDSTGKWDKGSMTIIFKDNATRQKHTVTIDNPTYKFYMLKPEFHVGYNQFFEQRDHLEEIEVPFNDLEREIAKRTGNLEFYNENIQMGNRSANRKLHSHPDIFSSDTNIEDHYRERFSHEYTNSICSISKSYFDIEADTINMKGDFPELGECPINAVTVIMEEYNKVFTFLLRNDKNPQIAEFEDYVRSGAIYPELKAFIQDAVGGYKKAHRFGILNFEYSFLFYDEAEEIRLIQDLFTCINQYQPDFVLAWNMSFDVPYIINRIIRLGYRPEDIMCNPDFKYPVVRYWIDERNRNEFAERGDFATISSYSTFLDQMIHFASRRKGQSAFSAFSLDFIGEFVAGVKKLDYKDITTNIAELPWKDYKTFVFYNIMDTIVQKCIESKTTDLEYVFGKCNINNTRYSKCHRQTIYLVNRGKKEFLKTDDFVIGNNVNKENQKGKPFAGAFIGDPTKLNDYSKMTIGGHISKLLENLIDLDFASLYPSLLRQFGMAPNTQIGMIVIDDKIWEGENRRGNLEDYTRSGEFIENLNSRVYLEFCHRWLNLGSYREVYHDIQEFFCTVRNPMVGLCFVSPSGLAIPANFINQELNTIPATIGETSLIVPAEFAAPINTERVKEVITDARNNPKQRFQYFN